jgi:hypothetical protein
MAIRQEPPLRRRGNKTRNHKIAGFDTHGRIGEPVMDSLVTIVLKIGSVVVTAVPARYRRTWPLHDDEDLRGPAIVSGLLEFLLSAPGTMFYFATVMSTARAGLGVAGFVLNPFWPFPFLLADGAVRFLAAFVSGQILPTFPLAIIARIHDRKDGKVAVAHLGPVVADKVERGERQPWDLRILSCRAKPHWNPYMTIRYEGEFYQMIQQDLAVGNRKFVYLLRKHPATRLVVVVYEYDPKDVLISNATPRRWKP